MAGAQELADRQITVGGKTYTLRFSIRAMAALQEHWGLKSINGIGAKLEALGDDMGADDLVAVVWSGLRTHHPELSKDDALSMLDEVGLGGLDGVIGDAFAAAAPPKQPSEGSGGGPSRPTKRGR